MMNSVKVEQTMMWQQNSYLADSGIQSGVTTQAPSIIGTDDEMNRDQIIFDLDQGFAQGYTQDQVDGNSKYLRYFYGKVIILFFVMI